MLRLIKKNYKYNVMKTKVTLKVGVHKTLRNLIK
nr:MAG TPA_asm: hypothetical protein [Caudoviricetes sp.]